LRGGLLLLASLLASAVARAEVERFAVLIGNNNGAVNEAALQYAESDATRMHDVLQDLGDFRPENLVLVRGGDADAARRAIIAMNDRIRLRTNQTVLVVYYSGHADADALHLGGTTIPLAELEELVRGSAASFRLLVVDACRSGALTRVKGGTPAPAFSVKVDERLAGEGAVFLTSSAANEDAQESDELGGSFFSHFFISGLLGAADTDGDGNVAIGEAYRYAYDNTLRATSSTWAGVQHPTFSYAIRGEGDFVLTHLAARETARGRLRLAAGRSYLVFAGRRGAVVAEVDATGGGRRLSLRPGSYFVRGRGPRDLVEGEVTLRAGEEVVVQDSGLERVEYARLVRKGGGNLRSTVGAEAGFFARSPILDGQSTCLGLFAAVAVDLPLVTLAARAGGCHATFANENLSADADTFNLDLVALHVFDLRWVSFDLGLSGGAALLHQAFSTMGTAPSRSSAAAVFGVEAGAAIGLVGGFDLLAGVTGQAFFLRHDAGPGTGDETFDGRVAAMVRVGLGKRW